MDALTSIAGEIRKTGFACTRCGDCCRDHPDAAFRVLVGAKEVRRIMAVSGRGWESCADPYPEFLTSESGCRITFAWVLQKREGSCRFFEEGGCSIYQGRPEICRTYPFMLTDEGLAVFECRGLGGEISWEDAYHLAGTLLSRKIRGEQEEKEIRRHFSREVLPPEGCVVIDSEGAKPVHE
ncbi:MAG: YkgJ family cysteine cluster protein [Methanomicrobiaceae archaeon]|nr:YkgJ family cysteine cluster protein [Methanomicrobiaceae archaeon]